MLDQHYYDSGHIELRWYNENGTYHLPNPGDWYLCNKYLAVYVVAENEFMEVYHHTLQDLKDNGIDVPLVISSQLEPIISTDGLTWADMKNESDLNALEGQSY